MINEEDLDFVQTPVNCFYSDIENFNVFASSNEKVDFSILHINARSLPKNFDSVLSFIRSVNNYPFSIIAITETWLYENDYTALYNIPNYTFVCKGRSDKRGGGVGLYIKSELEFTIINNFNISNQLESLFVEINCSGPKKIVTGVIYRPPREDVNAFINDFSDVLNNLNVDRKVCFVTGDFNINLLSRQNANMFENTLSSYSFYPVIDKPTRITEVSATLIDNIFTNINSVTKSTIIRTDISDHYPIVAICENLRPSRSNVRNITTFKRDTSISKVLNMKLELNSTDWQDVLGDNNAQSAYTTFHNKICDIFHRNCPMRQIKHKKNLQKSPWITSGILKSIRRKNVLYSSYKQSPTYHN
ncbi:hypothetical protein HOLleu_16116 [Holothuria leucospilota]|uniref:Endonuclease/exonuclease/phosphatase domain-containing protein n=1 Tax=Holothuria leucospilota TaxID=206669 RepID=A0A9Q1H7K8_HOLLE|nr:hypothetical protein HOLleu_16116 [Holothuria leucospilota]